MLLSISVDLDEIHHYYRIHGLDADDAVSAVYARAVPRLSDWAKQRGVPLTWFVVGQDLQIAANAEAATRLAGDGDELGCHSYSHWYDLTRRPFEEMQRDVQRGVAAIREKAGATATGFRAPGYVVTDTLLALLHEQGFAYDSSVFPCPSYYALKAAAYAKLMARGRESAAIVDRPEVLRAPTVPYRVGQPFWFRGTGIWEIPIQVTRRARLPFIGTSLTLAGAIGARLLAQGVAGEPFVNLELHGIDALDRQDGLETLAKYQPDLRVSWHKKLDAIDAALGVLRGKGYACVRMDELAARARAATT
ncbi:MAG TPA: polysaccharide deacetylase family protein [Polyangiaceae bacterium]|nr:polysaccharide deacetylase family protein [Polyangiaceae bacterium]